MHYLRTKGHVIGRYRVRQIMREHGLVCSIRKAYKGKSNGINRALVFAKHKLQPASINTLWVTDITYIKTTGGWRYLCVVLDAYSRRVIGYNFDNHMRLDLVAVALHQAFKTRNNNTQKVVIHSDRGSQFTSHEWHTTLKQLDLTGSMSGKGNCYDNAIMERFFGSLKDALLVNEPMTNTHTMNTKIEQWIIKYNYQRCHSSLGGLSPAQFERKMLKAA
jgi:putative transposase